MYQKLIDQLSALLCKEYGYTMTYSRNLDMHLPMRRSNEERNITSIHEKLSDDCMWVGYDRMYFIIDHSEEYVSSDLMNTYYISDDNEIMKKGHKSFMSLGNKDLYIAISLMNALIAETDDDFHMMYEVYSFVLIQEFLLEINDDAWYFIYHYEAISELITEVYASHIYSKESSIAIESESEQHVTNLLLKTEKNMLSRDEILEAIESTRADGSWGVDALYFRFLQKKLITAEELEQYDTCLNCAEYIAHTFRKTSELYSYPTQLTGILEDFYSSLEHAQLTLATTYQKGFI